MRRPDAITTDSEAAKPLSDPRGVVLITVLWIMVGLSLLALTLAATVRTEATLARASGEAEQAYFFARGALEAVLYRMAYPDPDPERQQAFFPYAGGMNHYRLRSRGLRCHVAVMDEAGKLDLNAAAPEILERLLRMVGANPFRAEIPGRGRRQLAQSRPRRRGRRNRPPPLPLRGRAAAGPRLRPRAALRPSPAAAGRAHRLPARPDGLPHGLHRQPPWST